MKKIFNELVDVVKPLIETDRVGLLLSYIGTILIVLSTKFYATGATIGGIGGKDKPFVVGENPQALQFGLVLIAIGFSVSYFKNLNIKQIVISLVLLSGIYALLLIML